MTRRRIAGALVIVLVAAIAVPLWRMPDAERRLVAHFTRAVGIHEGSDVRVLGVRVGRVVRVKPEGRTVRVEMRYDAAERFPADAKALIIPPSIVSDRYIQLAPAYVSGPALDDGADLPVTRTAAPMEIDDVYRALDEFNRALGPGGANANGALRDLVATGRANLEGNGADLHTTLDGLSKALSTVADGREDLFGTVTNLQVLATALARSDEQVRAFNRHLADVATQLAAERDELAAALRGLATALADITGFIKQNRAMLVSNVEALADITRVLVRQQRAIIEILDVAPLALSNLNLAYNARSGTLDTRNNLTGPYDPASYVCSVIAEAVSLERVPKECVALAQTLQARGLPLTDPLRKLLGLAAGPGGGPGAAPGASPPQPAGPSAPGLPHLPVDPGAVLDPTVGGILRGAP